jgi:hypothetical protein
MVRAAVAPAALDALDHELLLALTLGEEHVSIPEAEQARAAQLGTVLDQALPAADRETTALGPDPTVAPADRELQALVELGQALRAAAARGRIDDVANERLVREAMRNAAQPRGSWSRRWALLGSAAAIAAGVALFFVSFGWHGPNLGPRLQRAAQTTVHQAAVIELIPTRSTQALFDPETKFPVQGGESARVDKIASARAADLRANRFAQWGVR